MEYTIRLEDRFDGKEHFDAWKFKIMMTLEESDVKQFVDKASKQPPVEPHKSIWSKGNRKAIQIILDGVKNDIVPMLTKHQPTFDMMNALLNAYEVNNATKVLALKRQLNHIQINKGESMNSYFLRVAGIRDELSSIGTIISDTKLTLMAIDGLLNSWETFAQGISVRDKLPDFNRLEGDCLQEESRKLKKGGKLRTEDEELHVLNTNSYKGKKKHFKKKKGNQKNDKPKKDLSRIKCFSLEKFGHYKGGKPKTEDGELYVLNTNSFKGKKKHLKKKKGNQKNDKPKKDLSKIKCFICKKFEHYRSNCLENSKQQVNYTNITREEDNYDPKNRVLYSSLSNEVSSKAWVIYGGSS